MFCWASQNSTILDQEEDSRLANPSIEPCGLTKVIQRLPPCSGVSSNETENPVKGTCKEAFASP
jgi:hypothetical protein